MLTSSGGGVFSACFAVLFFITEGTLFSPERFFALYSGASIVCALALAAGYFLNDFLIRGRNGLIVHIALTFGSASIGLLLNLCGVVWSTLFLAFSVTMLLLLWGRYVAAMSHRVFVIMIAIIMLMSGIIGCFLCALSDIRIYVLFGWLSTVISLIFLILIVKNFPLDLPSQHNIEESKGNEAPMRVSFGPALSDGLMASVAFSLVFVDASQSDLGVFPMGIALILGSMVSLLQIMPNFKYELFLRSHASCFKPIPFLLLLLLHHFNSGVLACAAVLVTLGFVTMLVTSLTERIRLIGLSSFYVYGRHGIPFFLAAAAGFLIVGLASLSILPSVANEALLCIAILVVEWFLVGSQPWGTTFDHANSKLEKSEKQNTDHLKGHRRTWRNKVDSLARRYGLSVRQQEVLTLLAQGRNAAYIAEQLCITVATAKTHIYNIYLKLGIHTQQDLLKMVDRED